MPTQQPEDPLEFGRHGEPLVAVQSEHAIGFEQLLCARESLVARVLYRFREVVPRLRQIALPGLHGEPLRLGLEDNRPVPIQHEDVYLPSDTLPFEDLHIREHAILTEDVRQALVAKPLGEPAAMVTVGIPIFCIFGHPVRRRRVHGFGQGLVLKQQVAVASQADKRRRDDGVEVARTGEPLIPAAQSKRLQDDADDNWVETASRCDVANTEDESGQQITSSRLDPPRSAKDGLHSAAPNLDHRFGDRNGSTNCEPHVTPQPAVVFRVSHNREIEVLRLIRRFGTVDDRLPQSFTEVPSASRKKAV